MTPSSSHNAPPLPHHGGGAYLRVIYLSTVVLMTVALVLFATADSLPLAFLAAGTYGFGFSGMSPLRTFAISTALGSTSFATANGVLRIVELPLVMSASRSIFRMLSEEEMSVADIMTREVVTVQRDWTVEEAADTLLAHKISGAPVVEDNGRLCGIITQTDLFKATLYITGLKKPFATVRNRSIRKNSAIW